MVLMLLLGTLPTLFGFAGRIAVVRSLSAHKTEAAIGIREKRKREEIADKMADGAIGRCNTERPRKGRLGRSNIYPLRLQGDTSHCAKPPVDFKTKVLFWPGLVWPGQDKGELLF